MPRRSAKAEKLDTVQRTESSGYGTVEVADVMTLPVVEVTSHYRTSDSQPDLEALPQYLREIARGQLPTADEVKELARALRSDDCKAVEPARRRLIGSKL